MPNWNLNVTPGGATGSLSAPPGMGGGGSGPLMDMLRWKMQMMENAERLRAAQIKQQMQLAGQQYSDQRAAMRGRNKDGPFQGLSAGEEGGAGAGEWDRAYKYAQGLTGMDKSGWGGTRNPNETLNLARQIYAMGPERAHQGSMQYGGLMAGMATGAAGMASDQSQNLVNQGISPARQGPDFHGLRTPGIGATRSYKKGGLVPKTDTYKLHKDETEIDPDGSVGRIPKTGKYKVPKGATIIPAKLSDVLLPAISKSRRSKGKARASYEEGSPGYREILNALIANFAGSIPGLGAYAGETGGNIVPEGMAGGPEVDPRTMALVGSPPGMPAPQLDQGPTYGQMIGEALIPDIQYPQATPEELAAGPQQPTPEELAAAQPPQPEGYLGIEGLTKTMEPAIPGGYAESRGQSTVPTYKLEGKPETAEEKQARELDDLENQIGQHRDQARGLNTSAMNYQRWAVQNANKPSAGALREMAQDYAGQAAQMSKLADSMQKDLDSRREVMTMAEVQRDIAAIGAGGRQREAEVRAGGQIGAGREAGAQKSIGRYLEHLQDTDPEKYEQLETMLMLYLDPRLAGLFGGTGLE